MSKTKTAEITRFKVAFLKPKAPKRQARKFKSAMEKAVGKGRTEKTKDAGQKALANLSDKLKHVDENYLVDLMAYKITKHWDEPEEAELWVMNCGDPKHRVAALEKVLSDHPSKEMVMDVWKRYSDSPHITELCYKLYPQMLIDEAVKLEEKGGNAPAINSPAMKSKVALKIAKTSGVKKLPASMKQALLPEDAVEVAEKDPRGFTEVFLKDAVPNAKVQFLKEPKIRAAVAKNDEDWKALKASTPILPFLESVDSKVKGLTPPPTDVKAATAQAVFEELLSDTGAIKMTYYTNQLSPPLDVMAAPPGQTMDKLKTKREELEKVRDGSKDVQGKQEMQEKLDALPLIPGAQCDELVTLLMRSLECALGPDSGVECKHMVLKGMVLTVPISTLPGGLLKNTFGGNLYNDSDALTGQVLFTGNPDGDNPDAHTVLSVGGVKYDAVLGTVGDAVDKAVEEEFGQWDKKSYVSKDGKKTPIPVAKSKTTTNWIVKVPGLKAAPNKNGFSSAYRITTDVSKYADKLA